MPGTINNQDFILNFDKIYSEVFSMQNQEASTRIAIILLSVLTITSPLCIDELVGEDRGECTDYTGKICCNTFKYSIETLKSYNHTSDVNIALLGDVTISSIVKVIKFTNLIIWSQNMSALRCNASKNGSGLYFQEVRNLTITNVIIKGCSMLTQSTTSLSNDPNVLLSSLSAVYILKCHTVSLTEVHVSYNHGTGVIMYDTGGDVVIHNSTFEGNQVPLNSHYPGGGGLYVEFTCRLFMTVQENKNCTNEMANSSYLITETFFMDNYVFELNPNQTKFFNYDRGSYQGFGRGGGMCFILNGQTSSNLIRISNCTFSNNRASTWGGGMYISLRNNPYNNTFELYDTHFIENTCINEGGGGLKLSLLSYKGSSSSNVFSMVECDFIGNTAKTNGGGTCLVSSRETDISKIEDQLNNNINFTGCNWRRNKAELGSAMDIAPGVWNVLGNGILPFPLFRDCTFEDNYIMLDQVPLYDGIQQITSGVGTLLISNFAIAFDGAMNFMNNNGTAIYLQSGLITLLTGSELTITNNVAKHGGAIAFIAFSVMYIASNTKITLKNNEAYIKGGAIYAKSIDQHDRFSSRSCFLQSTDRNTMRDERNVTITFKNNVARSGSGNSIYATSFQSCMYSCTESTNSTKETTKVYSIFDCLGTITGLDLAKNDISTHSRKFQYDPRYPLNKGMIIPGRYFKIPIASFDELDQPSKIVYDLSLSKSNNITLDDANSAYISNQRIRVLASNHTERNSLLLERDEITIQINITTIECPPGHYLNDSVCLCDTTRFRGIWKCDRRNKIASIINGFWIGQCSNGEQCTGLCPIGYCTENISTDLPTRINDTDQYVCTNNRRGKLCGTCVQNHSAYYHSAIKRCGEESLCRYGIVFYILSELLPLTFIFIIIIIYNISFTNGSTNGFILYAQMLDSLIINFYNVVHFPKAIQTLNDIQHFIYSAFNLNFFNLEQLSFCLWEGATTLDTLAWTYFTIVYALFLVLFTVWLFNRATCKKICLCWRSHTLKSTVVHGLTAFLVMCYSQCARVSFQLLNTVNLMGYNMSNVDKVIQFSGEQKLFDSVHIRYGLTAIVFVCVIVILPPLLLFLYPLCLKFLALCKLSELKLVVKFTNIIPMPLFDSFQSCYKDRFRFFSGLYFFYRVTPLLLYAMQPDVVVFYFLVEIFLILALFVHAILQPYKELKHNIIDSFIFTNLAIINAISLFNYQKVTEGKDNLDEAKHALTITTTIQLVLIYLPLVCVVIYSIWWALNWIKKNRKMKKISRLDHTQQILLDSTYLPPLRDSSETPNFKLRDHRYHEIESH